MVKSTKKSTRKFEKNKLKDTIQKRKATSKIKQRQQIKAKKQARNVNLAAERDDSNSDISTHTPKDSLVNMSVDDFFQGGIEIPQDTRITKSKLAQRQNAKRKISELDNEKESSSGSSFSEASYPSESEDSGGNEEESELNKNPINRLSEIDPEFHKYLKENDPEALDFDENADFDEIDELSASDGEHQRKKQKKPTGEENSDGGGSSSDVTKEMVSKWTKAMTEQFSLRALRQAVLAFRAAAYVDEDEARKHKYYISSPEVYHDVVSTVLKNVPLVLQHHLPIKEQASGKTRVSTDSKKFKTLSPLLKSHSMSLIHLLSTLSDASTIKITLSCITILIPYLISFKKLLKRIMKTVVDIWSDSSNTQATRITAFLVLRRLAVLGDSGTRETILKIIYQGLIKNCRSTTIHSIQDINLMKNSATELWGLDAFVGYTTGFTFIRQLAIHLRKSITNNQKESYKTIYNWQYIHSLDFWSCVLSEHCSPIKEATTGKESELRPLIYPIVQITLGALRLIPTAMYFPLRFHLIRSLLRLSRATGTYIPLASSLLEVLNSNEMKKPPKASTLKPFDFEFNYKAQKTYLHTRVYQDNIGEQVVELLAEFFVLWCTNIAFPELALPVVIMLKRWLKDVTKKPKGNKNMKVSSMITLLVQKLEANGKWIQEKRSKVDFAPNNRKNVDDFLKDFDWQKTPLGAFVAGQRKQREERASLVQEARQQEVMDKTVDREKEKTNNEVEWNDDSSNDSDTG